MLSAACSCHRLLCCCCSSSLDIVLMIFIVYLTQFQNHPLMFLLLTFFSQFSREKCVCVCSAFRHALWSVSPHHNGTAIKIYMKNSPNYENAIKVMQVNDSIALHKDPSIPRERETKPESLCAFHCATILICISQLCQKPIEIYGKVRNC